MDNDDVWEVDPADRTVEVAIRGHVAGNFSREQLLTSSNLEWPETWKTRESKAYPRFEAIELCPATSSWSRRSERVFGVGSVSGEQISMMLRPLFLGNGGRDAPSAGGLYPVETYIVSINSELPVATYHYDRESHAVVRLFDLDQTVLTTSDHGVGLTQVENASILVVFTAVLYRSMRKYGPRAYRYMLMEAGAMATTVELTLPALELGSVWLGGFDDVRVASMLGLRPELDLEVPVLILAVGQTPESKPS